MKRYLTTEPMDDLGIAVFTEADDCVAAMDNAHCWVWQFANSPEEAVSQHTAKFEEWESDINNGRPEKLTY